MKKTYDIVIVGCGMAGALAGITALKEGLSVCIVERKQRELIGKKVCGELMPQKTLEWLKNQFSIAVEYYPLKGLVISTSLEDSLHNKLSPLRVDEPLCTIDRWQFGQVMVKELLERGADIIHKAAEAPFYEHCVKGVKTEDSTLYSTVTIDCSGISSVLRRKIPFTSLKAPRFGVAYKEDVILEEPLPLEYALLLLDKNVIPSGYMWLFPKSEYILNAGVGGLVQGQASLRNALRKTLETHFAVRERTRAGFGVLPLGPPVPSLVYPGLLVCGDAACQVNPLTGEGIAPALMAGHCAGITAAQAVQNNDVSVKGMWQYNYECATQYGILFGSLCVLRDFLVSLSDEELTFLLKNMVTSEDLAQLENDWSPSVRSMMTILLNSWKKPILLYRLYKVFKKMTKIKKLYQCYPEEPEAFPIWEKNLDAFFK